MVYGCFKVSLNKIYKGLQIIQNTFSLLAVSRHFHPIFATRFGALITCQRFPGTVLPYHRAEQNSVERF